MPKTCCKHWFKDFIKNWSKLACILVSFLFTSCLCTLSMKLHSNGFWNNLTSKSMTLSIFQSFCPISTRVSVPWVEELCCRYNSWVLAPQLLSWFAVITSICLREVLLMRYETHFYVSLLNFFQKITNILLKFAKAFLSLWWVIHFSE